jgi:hypothetical protein
MYLPPLRAAFGTAAVPAGDLLLLVPLPFIVWGVDELYRALRRRNTSPSSAGGTLNLLESAGR